MGKKVPLEGLTVKLGEELTMYHQEAVRRLNNATRNAAKKLVKLTKETAPADRPSFRNNIASKCYERHMNGNTYVWYVKGPDARLTHLLVNGHATRDGGRTKGNPFLKNALDEVLPEYEREMEDVFNVW